MWSGGLRRRSSVGGVSSTAGQSASGGRYEPIVARTSTSHVSTAPSARDCVTVIVVRRGAATACGDLDPVRVAPGDVVLLGGSTRCGLDPDGSVTTTTLHLDSDYIVDQLFWQNAAVVSDRLFAWQFAESTYTEPAQILRLGPERAGLIAPWLDELVMLSCAQELPTRFWRMQALLFAVLDVIIPFVRTSADDAGTDVAGRAPAARHRQFLPLRAEATFVRDLLHDAPSEPWTLAILAERVHLSEKQLTRVFVEAYGRTPLEYLTATRVERMAHLLRRDELSVAVAGQAVGWASRSRAAEAFRRCTGVTPQQYRSRVRDARDR